MSIQCVRDLNDELETGEHWYPAMFRLAQSGSLDGTSPARETYVVAWGTCYAAWASGVWFTGWYENRNTDENGQEFFDTEARAAAYLDDVAAAIEVTHPEVER